jgi:hypothetical protein
MAFAANRSPRVGAAARDVLIIFFVCAYEAHEQRALCKGSRSISACDRLATRDARDSLPTRNEKAPLRMRLCARRRSHFYRMKFIPERCRDQRKMISQIPAMTPLSVQEKQKMESNMLNKLLGAAAMVAVAYAVVPANAAKMGGGCSGPNLAKTESMIDTMADGEGKIMAQKEIAMAQDAMLSGKMGACGMHLSKAMHAGMAK